MKRQKPLTRLQYELREALAEAASASEDERERAERRVTVLFALRQIEEIGERA